jgi:hypothetical protein
MTTRHEIGNSPRYVHACRVCGDRCVWLGRHGMHDLYACTSHARGVVLIARFGSYEFGISSFGLRGFRGEAADLTEPFRTAYQLAKGQEA